MCKRIVGLKLIRKCQNDLRGKIGNPFEFALPNRFALSPNSFDLLFGIG